MKEINVRIVKLEPLRVASALGFGTEPEGQAIGLLAAWLKDQGRLARLAEHRFFGFNNPDPSAGSPNYGYEQWVTVGPEAQGSREVSIQEFPGGLYAVMAIEGLPSPEKWARLVRWCEDSPYRQAHHQWLEESLTPERLLTLLGPEPDFAALRFDLYLPVAA
ncbi:MAG TPA: GyrI-like domain-containing protein [Anaerolineaceae bacterium]|nr:GyrI-like domain-containing protein [Anaerolineaceae bacterium]